jgi:hypothetical protein
MQQLVKEALAYELRHQQSMAARGYMLGHWQCMVAMADAENV